ncbi:MAG: hypothetical protein QOK49_1487 [Baekduia sp.]|jgi:hypothetical protein|nr:hypothetical protein [Baekduia sp.]
MITRLRRAFGVLAPEQRRVGLAALLVLGSMLLPWYSKTTNAITSQGLAATHESKMAITVPSFVEASIFLVAIAVLVLMFARGERRAFHLPFGDGIVVTAAGAWVGFLVFYRFVDQPAGGTTKTLAYSYDLSWGIFFGLLAAAFLAYAGTRLKLSSVAEPPLPGDDPTTAASRPRRQRPPRAAREPREDAEAAARRRREAPTETRPPEDPPTAATSVAPARRPARPEPRDRPEVDGGTQLSFDEQE